MTVQRPCTSAVTARSQDALVGSAMANGTTLRQCALRPHDFHEAWGTPAPLGWRQTSSHVAVPERSTFHQPLPSRGLVAPGASGHAKAQRREGTPPIQGVSPSPPRSHRVLRWAGSLAVVCGVRLRHRALLFSALCLLPMTPSSRQRWMAAKGAPWPRPAARLRPRRALAPATACPLDGSSPVGPDPGGLGGQEEPARLLRTQEAASEQGEEARPCLPHVTDRGLPGTAACSADAHRFPDALNAGLPQARWPAAQVQTVTPRWGHRHTARLSSRRQVKASGTDTNAAPRMAVANQRGKWRGSLLKTPAQRSGEAKPAMAARAREEAGCVHRFRSRIRPRVPRCDSAHSAAQAQRPRHPRRQESNAVDDAHRHKMLPFFDAPWDQALRYRRKKGRGKHRRGSNAESGRRLRRRREKNHDGIRSAATRQHSRQL